MTNFVLGLFVVQMLIGAYQIAHVFSAETDTRLPDVALLFHPMLGGTAALFWVIYMGVGGVGFAWASFGALTLGASLGLVMFARTLAEPAEAVEHPSVVGAAKPLAEKRIPGPMLAVHGLGATLLFVCTLLVALGVAN